MYPLLTVVPVRVAEVAKMLGERANKVAKVVAKCRKNTVMISSDRCRILNLTQKISTCTCGYSSLLQRRLVTRSEIYTSSTGRVLVLANMS